MLTKQQIADRKLGCGGSDIAAILGLDRFRQAVDVFMEKTGAVEPDDLSNNDSVQMGNLIEDAIGKLGARRQQYEVQRVNQTIIHPKYDWARANIDRRVVGADPKRGVEIKMVGMSASGAWGPHMTSQIAEYYEPQVRWYQFVTDWPAWDVFAWIGGQDLRIYEMQNDPEWNEMVLDIVHDFWHENVLKNVPPEFDYDHPRAAELLKRMYGSTDGTMRELGEDIAYWHQVKLDAEREAKRYQAVVDGAKAHIMHAMGNAAVGILPDGTGYTRKQITVKEHTVAASSYVRLSHTKKPAGVKT